MPKKLPELLAVETTLHGQAETTRTDLIKTFTSKRHLFESRNVVFSPFVETAELPTREEEHGTLNSTIARELTWITPILTKAIDVGLAVDRTNQSAQADLTLEDGSVLLKNVPTTALLGLGHRASEIASLIEAIPTLDPAKGFEPDPDMGTDVMKARPIVRTRTEKKSNIPLTISAATDKFPAQVTLVSEDIKVGTVTTTEWSGLITSAAKAEMLSRIEELKRAIKQARQRANDREADQSSLVGQRLCDFVFRGQRPTDQAG